MLTVGKLQLFCLFYAYHVKEPSMASYAEIFPLKHQKLISNEGKRETLHRYLDHC